MQTRRLITLLLLLVAGFMTSCGGDSEANDQQTVSSEPESASASSGTNDAAPGSNGNINVEEALSKAMKELNGGEDAKEVVDFRKLKELLPESVAGMDRASHDGKKVGAMGMKFSTAQAQYKKGDEVLAVSIIDFAGVSYFLASSAAWATMEIDEESDKGYKRTTTIDGYKAFEEYNKQDRKGQVSIIAEGRYIVSIEGRNVDDSVLKAALDAVDVGGLKGLE